jgi:hypothetical protein
MRNRRLAGTAVSVALVLSGVPGSEGAIRTDRVSGKTLQTWRSIVAVVMAEDRAGRPLHLTLRRLWDTVEASSHTVYVEMPKGRRSYIAGRFAVTKVDPSGKAHEAILMMNLRAIDRTATGRGAARPNGFIPLAGLGKLERYAEVLGHELAHAVWTLADPERAVVAQPLQGDGERLMSRVVMAASGSGPGDELRERAREFERLTRELEESAEATEEAVWAELLAGRMAR